MLEESEDFFFVPVSREEIEREKRKARDLRNSQWWKNQLARGRCHYCGEQFHPRQLTMDHVVPLVRGGRTTRANVVTCCKQCNNDKQNQLPSEWREHLQRLRSRSSRK